MNIRVLILLVVLVGLAGCSAEQSAKASNDVGLLPQPVQADKSLEPQVCGEPRPQACTMIYIPVCATLKDGSSKTYASGCVACSDVNVESFVDFECEG